MNYSVEQIRPKVFCFGLNKSGTKSFGNYMMLLDGPYHLFNMFIHLARIHFV